MELIKENDVFKTSHFALACYLFYLGFELLGLEGKDKKTFLFKRDNGLDEAVQNFWRKQGRVEPENFLLTAKNLKSRLYDMEYQNAEDESEDLDEETYDEE